MKFYVGTYTGEKSKGIYAFNLNLRTGVMTPEGLAAEIASPSFLAIHPSSEFLYAANEVGQFSGRKTGAVSAYRMEGAGKLTLLNQISSGGGGPCHLVVDKTGKNVLVANYGGGNVSVLPIGPDGKLSEASAFIQHTGASVNPDRQKEPHAHSINVSPDNRFAFAADLGLDKIFIYRLDAKTGKLTPSDPAFAKVSAGAGPRHFAFHPSGRFAYVINELHSTVTAFAYDQKGELKELQTISTLPPKTDASAAPVKNNSTAEVQVHPSGKFLYGSNRGHNSIVVYSIDRDTGQLKYVENESTQGRTPRNFGIDPTGAYLLAANQESDSIVGFRIDPATGQLNPTGQRVEVGAPVCIKFAAQR